MSDGTNEKEQGAPDMGADGQQQKKVGLPKPPLFTSDYITMAEILQFAMERFGQLVLALMYYTTDGTMPDDLPPDINMMFGIYQRKVDAAREKYKNKCAVNAENGAKGGKAKAKNAKKMAAGPKFTPPTQKQFRDAVQHFADNDEIPEDTTDYDTDAFFDELKDSGWTIGGAPIQSRADWEAAIRAKFYQFSSTLPDHFFYEIFSAAFAELHDGEKSDFVASDFMDAYDEAAKRWNVQGEYFPTPDWKSALARFMGGYSESSDT